MKNCIMCGEPFSGKRSDSKYCSNSCKAKNHELKLKDQLPKNGLHGFNELMDKNYLPKNESDVPLKTKQRYDSSEHNKTKNVDQDDLTPFNNLVNEQNDFDDVVSNNSIQKTERLPQNNRLMQAFHSLGDPSKLPARFIKKEITKDNPVFLSNKNQLLQFDKSIQQCDTEIERLHALLKKVENDTGNMFLFGGLATGGVIAGILYTAPPNDIQALEKSNNTHAKRYLSQYKKENSATSTQNIITVLASILIGGAIGAVLKNDYKENNKVSKIEAVKMYRSKLKEITDIKDKLIAEKSNLIVANYFVKSKLIETIEVENPDYDLALKQLNGKMNNLGSVNPDMNQNQSLSNADKSTNLFGDLIKTPIIPIDKPNPLENDKVSSMKKVAGLKFQLLDFKGKWNDFFGLPQTNFFCVVHGMSGEGKTNFSIQLAKYLAENFGDVLYVSGEEGFAPTFQQKIKDLGADSIPRLYAADIRTGQELITSIPNRYHFIVIDSVNNMDIDPDMMKAIRQKFKQSGIIAICQSTKDGKIRGSYQMVHDSDIAVKVVNGMATTTKNRFKEKNQEFDVFAVYNKSKLRIIKKTGTNDDFGRLDFNNTI